MPSSLNQPIEGIGVKKYTGEAEGAPCRFWALRVGNTLKCLRFGRSAAVEEKGMGDRPKTPAIQEGTVADGAFRLAWVGQTASAIATRPRPPSPLAQSPAANRGN